MTKAKPKDNDVSDTSERKAFELKRLVSSYLERYGRLGFLEGEAGLHREIWAAIDALAGQARAGASPEPCCQEFEKCDKPCSPRATFWRDEAIALAKSARFDGSAQGAVPAEPPHKPSWDRLLHLAQEEQCDAAASVQEGGSFNLQEWAELVLRLERWAVPAEPVAPSMPLDELYARTQQGLLSLDEFVAIVAALPTAGAPAALPADVLDAMRYRWLGSHCTLVEQDKRSSLPGLRLVVHAQSWTTCADWSKLNEAIDAAMASNQTPLAPSGE